jgi:predicted nucleic acid-binding protein
MVRNVKVMPMPDIFADTAGWGHLIDATQAYHARAADLYRSARQQGHKLITSNYILTELVALLTSPLRLPRPAIIAFIEGLKASPYVEIVHVDASLDAQAWQLLTERLDKNWSLVDCASFVMMRHRDITDAFTTDHHFEQAGFVRLLKG